MSTKEAELSASNVFSEESPASEDSIPSMGASWSVTTVWCVYSKATASMTTENAP